MEKYCSYCSSKIFDNDRVCPQCGAPTKNYIVIKSPKENIDFIKSKKAEEPIGELDWLYPFSDIRFGSREDSFLFNISKRDIFVKLKNGRESKQSELSRYFDGSIHLSPNLDSFSSEDILNLFSVAVQSVENHSDSGLKVSGFSQAEFVRLSQTVSAWNGGSKVIVLGYKEDVVSFLPTTPEYRFQLNLENKIEYIQNFLGTDILVFPNPKKHNDEKFTFKLRTGELQFVSPTKNKLLKIVFENESLSPVGIAVGINSTFATMRI